VPKEQAEPRWLNVDERVAWLSAAALVIKLPAALDAQLQADAGLGFFEYMVLAVLSEQPDHTLQMSQIASLASPPPRSLACRTPLSAWRSRATSCTQLPGAAGGCRQRCRGRIAMRASSSWFGALTAAGLPAGGLALPRCFLWCPGLI
jgi:hypothetical protein